MTEAEREVLRLRRVLHHVYGNLDALLLYATGYPGDSHVLQARKFMANVRDDLEIVRPPRTETAFPPLPDKYCLPPYPVRPRG